MHKHPRVGVEGAADLAAVPLAAVVPRANGLFVVLIADKPAYARPAASRKPGSPDRMLESTSGAGPMP
jgi:hypothetical protein